mgnify:CR=1 FL=1
MQQKKINLPLAVSSWDEEEINALKEVIEGNNFTMGKGVKIFEEEDSLDNLESFSSYNGPTFYGFPINAEHINLKKETWIVPQYTIENNVKIRNFQGGKKLNWKVI